MNQSKSIELLKALYPGALQVGIEQLALALSQHPQTIRNQVSEGTFPIPTYCIGARRYAAIIDVASYLDGLRSGITRTRRGRPRKAEQIARRESAASATAQQ